MVLNRLLRPEQTPVTQAERQAADGWIDRAKFGGQITGAQAGERCARPATARTWKVAVMRRRVGLVAVVVVGGLLGGAGCTAQEPSLRERLVQDMRSDPAYKEYSDKQVECMADVEIKYATPEALEQILQGKTPAGSGWKEGVDGKALSNAFAACEGSLAPSPTE
ncbi:hypothetical protein ACTWPT_13900 [Nonomuraea sp. 3N208]|uniref:hypothetical protein n=1 Tax=Nonomuraea sp. 3N208 TaxID=3457421 RepID=UPI003FCD9DE6